MKDKIPYYNEKLQELKNGAENGYCRICNNKKRLTIDHIPPKSCGNKHKLIITIGDRQMISQNGLNCKTICDVCNNELLGSDLDKQLKNIYDRLLSYKRSNLIIPNGILEIQVDVIKLLRSILGHFTAINVYDEKSSVKEILEKPVEDNGFVFNHYRRFVLGEITSIPEHILYYWYYPYYEIKIMPYFGLSTDIRIPQNSVVMGTLIKIFPIAIYLINTEKSNVFPNTYSIDLNNKEQLDKMQFRTNELIHKEWPEKPTKYGLIMANMGSSFDVCR